MTSKLSGTATSFLLMLCFINIGKAFLTNPPQIKKQNETSNPNNYNSNEYFQFNQYSYFDIEIEMIKYRLPQISNKQPVPPQPNPKV